MTTLTPEDCPRYQRCSAPICPLDPLWPKAVHLDGEKVCPYLLATGKAGADDRYRDDQVYQACKLALPLVTAAHPAIGRGVAYASRFGFPGDGSRQNLRKAQQARQERLAADCGQGSAPEATAEPTGGP